MATSATNLSASEEEADSDFKPRSYQLELFNTALNKNSILVLGTGSGKTFISILLIKELGHQIQGSLKGGSKRTVFVVNTVPLVYQQAKAIQKHTPFTVGKYEHSMGVDYWTDKEWQNELDKHEVLVVVAQIFRDLILHKRLPLSTVNLLIMDECHHTTGNHPMRDIMREYENLKKHSPCNLPRVLGLTACVVHRKCKKEAVFKDMRTLEEAMDCALVTSVDPDTVQKFTTGPKEKVVSFFSEGIPTSYQNYVSARFVDLACNIIEEFSLDGKIKEEITKKIRRKVEGIKSVMSDLGDWCGAQAIMYEIETLTETEGMEKNPKVREIWKLLRERLSEVYAACKLKEKLMANPMDNITFKVKRLLEVLSNCKGEVFGLVFVEKRNTAKILYMLLLEIAKQNPEFSFVKPSYVVGCNSHPGVDVRLAELELRKQNETLEKFRKGETNFLISTSVLEEGVDIRMCNVVVRFDIPQNYRAYIQSRGRARAKPSVYVLMVEETKASKFVGCIEVYKEIEALLQSWCHSRNLPAAQITRDHFAKDEYIQPYEPYGPEGPKITSNSAIQLVNLYCGKLPSDRFTDNLPEIVEQVKDRVITIGIRLPIMAPLKETIYGSGWKNRDLAKKSAALQLCIKLHEMGELNSNLRPKESTDNSLVEGLVDLPPEEPVPDGTSETGTRKRKRVYAKDICCQFSYVHGKSYCLYSIDMKPFGQRKASVTIESSSSNTKIGFICKEGLVSSPFPLFSSKWGDVIVNVREVGPLSDFSTVLFDKIKKFHRLVFENLQLESKLTYFDPEEFKCGLFIVPLDFSESIDLNVLNQVYSCDSLRPMKLKSSIQNTKFIRSDFEDALIYPLYGTSDQLYYVSQILDEQNPFNKFPEVKKGFESYEDYFLVRYGLEVKNKNQPLLEAKHIPEELNYLKKITKTSKKKEGKLVPCFIPEFCGLFPLKASVWWQIMCIPSIFHRLNSLNLMQEFIKETGITLTTSDHKVFDFSWTKTLIYELLGSSENTVQKFLNRKNYDYIHPFNMLHAFTLKEASEDFNLERLELLGDSFLKFATGEALFLREENYHEGRLSLSRGKLVCNKTLFRLACQKGLAGKIAAKVFNPKRNGFTPGFGIKPNFEKRLRSLEVPQDFWHQIPSTVKDVFDLKEAVHDLMSDDASKDNKVENRSLCYNPWTEHKVSDKSIADCTEAITGAYLLVCGEEAAASFLDWLGIGVFKGKSLLMEPKIVRTACVREKCAQDIEMLYKRAVLKRLEEKIGYSFRDRSFIVQAVTHSSYRNNLVTDCYQRLEFLGDAVLDYLVTCHLFCRFTDYSPGKLSDLRSFLVKNDTLARAAVKGGFHQHLLHRNPKLEASIGTFLSILEQDPLGEEFSTEDDVQDCDDVEVPKALGDMVEAIIGAVFLDSNRSLKVTWRIIQRILGDQLNASFEDVHLNPVRVLFEEVPGEKQVVFKKNNDNGSDTSSFTVTVNGFGTFIAHGKNY